MGWCADNHLTAVKKYVRNVYGKNAFTNHFIIRTYQRFGPEDRLAIFAELRELIKGGMFQYLFSPGKNDVEVVLNNKLKVCLARSVSGDLVIKTVFEPTPSQMRRLTVQ